MRPNRSQPMLPSEVRRNLPRADRYQQRGTTWQAKCVLPGGVMVSTGRTVLKGGHMMAQLHLYRSLTLQEGLEEVIRLGKGYRFTGAGKEWNPSDLLEWLQQKHPDLLSLPVALFPPSAHADGVV